MIKEGHMKRYVLALVAGILLLVLVPGSATALVPGDLDQHSNLVPNSLGSVADQAQTFTAGRTGSLDDVELYLNGSGTITVTIQSVSGGLPDGTVLATATAAPAGAAGWVDFAFASPASVTSGVMYAIVFNTGPDAAVWGTAAGDPDNYSSGQALRNNGIWGANPFIGDFGFATYVSTSAAASTPPSNSTPPPTATGDHSSSGDPAPVMLLSAGLMAWCGGMLAFLRSKRRGLYRA
jgi:hypothetical protein